MRRGLEIHRIADSPSAAWRLESEVLSIVVSEQGARISSVTSRSGDDERQISVDTAADPGYHGASIGRWANRINNARFELEGRRYELAANEGRHQLHGGPGGFHTRVWNGSADLDDDRAAVVLLLNSPDGDQGFPGRLNVSATIGLAANRLTIDYRATSTAATPVNLTNHLYWNLAGDGSLAGHQLTVAANRFVAVDNDKIPVAGAPTPVAGTEFDCRQSRLVDDIVAGGGLDHCFLFDESAVEPQVVLSHRDGLSVSYATNQMGTQIYTGQHLEPDRRAIAIEPQRPPDMVNRPDFGDAILQPGDDYLSTTTIEIAR